MSIDENTDTPRPTTARTAERSPRTGPGRQSPWSLLRPVVLRMHFYAGVLVAPFILVAAVTGLLYVWTPQLEQALYDHELHVPVGQERLPLREQVAAAQDARPDGTLNAVRPGAEPGDTTRVLLDVDGLAESHRLGVFVDPYTGEVRGSLDSYGSSGALPVRTWIDLLHRNLHMGEAGRVYSELAASWMWLVAAGGVALWVSRRRRWRRLRGVLLPEPGARGLRRTLSFHGAVGLWLFAGLLFMSATGLTWSQFAGENVTAIRTALAWETPEVTAETPAGGVGQIGVDAGIDRVLANARQADIDGPVEITYPARDGDVYTVAELDKHWPTSVDTVAVAPATGEVVDKVRFTDYPLMAKLSRWGVDAHMGLLFGVANQILLTALALGLVAVMALGYRMWWRRRPGTGSAMGRPVPRGAWKALPWRFKATVAATAIGVGYLMPVLGASLLLFLVVDIVLGRLPDRSDRPGRQGTPTGPPPPPPPTAPAPGS